MNFSNLFIYLFIWQTCVEMAKVLQYRVGFWDHGYITSDFVTLIHH
jgi:hypothetical protein